MVAINYNLSRVRRVRKEDDRFKISMVCIGIPCFKQKKREREREGKQGRNRREAPAGGGWSL